ncbi:TPA: serine hydroxymethyltransferase [bacterium]|nr:serine hydroxymethyltransferase [bacterium]
MKDKIIEQLIKDEKKRQRSHIQLIASENFVSKDVLKANGSVLTNKYAEGYPSRRYYGGCQVVDQVENIAIERAQKLFKTDYHVNVQPHSGSQANMAVYKAFLNVGDTILSMDLNSGGHLTHGSPVNFSGVEYNIISYGLNKETEMIDYDDLEKKALEHKPKLIVVGASAYSRTIDFERCGEIAKKVNAYLLADIAHVAGLIVTGLHPSPIGHADFITSTTHKTLRGPRGGLILCKKEHGKKIDKSLFPGIQGGPLMHTVAAKAVCFKEAASEDFVNYQKQVLNNIKAMEDYFKENNVKLVSGGSDNHLLLIDTKASFGVTGKMAEKLLDDIGITCNKNMIAFDSEKPNVTSGIRIGSPAMTSLGFKEREFREIAVLISDCLNKSQSKEELRIRVKKLIKK